MSAPFLIKTISEYHRINDLPKPEHPLISVVRFEDIKYRKHDLTKAVTRDFYSVALKKNFHAKLRYGQQDFDFDEGVMHFMAPKQILSIEGTSEEDYKHTGWLVMIHPDFLWNTPLAKKIKHYEYFDYKVNEALHLSDKEETLVTDLIKNIANEYHTNMDTLSQDVIIAQLELLLTYSERFYQRQFMTRKISNHKILSQLETLLSDYFKEDALSHKGIPSVQFIADRLTISPNYLSRLLKLLTGQSTKQFIQDKVIDLAKEKLSTSENSVSEIAYALGFEHPQSFSKLFKAKVGQSPIEFRTLYSS